MAVINQKSVSDDMKIYAEIKAGGGTVQSVNGVTPDSSGNVVIGGAGGGGSIVVDSTTNGNIKVDGSEVVVYDGSGKADVNHTHSGVYEPVFTKNTGFNKNLGTTSGTVSEGNHTHTDLHTHSNKTTLDKLSDNGTSLLFNGGAIGSGGGGGGIGIYGSPIASITASGRTIVNVSSVDVTGNVFTSATPHGLTNGWVIHPTLNDNAGTVYLPNVITGGVTSGNKYFVINVTSTTFQLSNTSGGASITLSTNANMDVTKWHFESASTESSTLEITGLTAKKKYRAILRGKSLRNDIIYCSPSTWDTTLSQWLGAGRNAFTTGYLGNGGNAGIFVELLFNAESPFASIRADGMHLKTNTTTQNTWTIISDTIVSPFYGNTNFTAIKTTLGGGFANGTVLEVYEA